MIIKKNRKNLGGFFGCSQFPECSGTRTLKVGGYPVSFPVMPTTYVDDNEEATGDGLTLTEALEREIP